MAQTLRISLETFNALTETDLDNFALYADADNVLIKEHSRGSGTLSLGSSATINHNLGYIPSYMVWGEISSGVYRLVNAQSPVGGGWKAYSTTTDLIITNSHSATFTGYRYYIFYDDMTVSGSPTITESDFVFKMSKDGVDAMTSVNPNDYIFHSDLNTFKILAEGNILAETVSGSPTTITLNHNMGEILTVYGFAKFEDGYVCQAGSKERADNTKPVERYWRIESDANNIRFLFYKGGTADYDVDIKYYIFETPAT